MKGLTALHSHGRGEKVKKFEARPGPHHPNERSKAKASKSKQASTKRSHPRIQSAVLHEPASERKKKRRIRDRDRTRMSIGCIDKTGELYKYISVQDTYILTLEGRDRGQGWTRTRGKMEERKTKKTR